MPSWVEFTLWFLAAALFAFGIMAVVLSYLKEPPQLAGLDLPSSLRAIYLPQMFLIRLSATAV